MTNFIKTLSSIPLIGRLLMAAIFVSPWEKWVRLP